MSVTREEVQRLLCEANALYNAIPRDPARPWEPIRGPATEAAHQASKRYGEALRELEQQERLELEQRSGAEVPGFHARTVIDDTIGKLWALRKQLRTEIPDEVAGLLDDVEALTERLVDLAFDPDALEAIDMVKVGEQTLLTSRSEAVCWCSCGSPCL